ncbi:heavy metal-binding domain-containing protein [Palleronia sp. LCG004]|uniref:heavy metal-binding domain-containing protein n=1 Tax=Palleronia sp. LCG004 TaxID=3079304 RepID=UPI00397D8C9A
MPVVRIDTAPCRVIDKTLGPSLGSTVRARHVSSDIAAPLCNVAIGKIRQYAEHSADVQRRTFDRMVTGTRRRGANAIVYARFETSQISLKVEEGYGRPVRSN